MGMPVSLALPEPGGAECSEFSDCLPVSRTFKLATPSWLDRRCIDLFNGHHSIYLWKRSQIL